MFYKVSILYIIRHCAKISFISFLSAISAFTVQGVNSPYFSLSVQFLILFSYYFIIFSILYFSIDKIVNKLLNKFSSVYPEEYKLKTFQR